MIVDGHTEVCNHLIEKPGSSSHTVTYVKWSIRSCWGSSSSCQTWFLLGSLSGAIYSVPHPWPHTCTPRFERPKSIKAWTHHRHVHVSYTFQGHTAGRSRSRLVPALFEDERMLVTMCPSDLSQKLQTKKPLSSRSFQHAISRKHTLAR